MSLRNITKLYLALLEDVIKEHPILGGFPPAISAAAGCIGIQNTAIIIRGLGKYSIWL
jgi:Mg/Co/Ni transporter MgtE